MKKYRNKNGQLHRLDGPAVEDEWRKVWYKNGKLHREDGPAVEYEDWYKEWWIDGTQYVPVESKKTGVVTIAGQEFVSV